jgi:hypothetical protein
MLLETFFDVSDMWLVHFRCSSIWTPRNFEEETEGIVVPSISRFWLESGIDFLLDLNTIQLVFDMLSDNLFDLNQSFVLISSSFAIEISWSYDALDRNALVSSANRINLNILVELGRSLMYIKNSRGPSIEPW